MCFFFSRKRRDGGSALEDAFIMDMLISEESDEDEYDEDEFDDDEELDEFDDEFFGPPGPETPEESAPARPRGRGRGITLSDLIFWETIFGDDD